MIFSFQKLKPHLIKTTKIHQHIIDAEKLPEGAVWRFRQEGDTFSPLGLDGSKKLKDYFIDKKIPASQRLRIPVIGDEAGVLAVYGFGVNLDRKVETLPGLQITFETLTQDNE